MTFAVPTNFAARSIRVLTLGLVMGSLALAGCDDDESPTAITPETAQLRAIHLSPDAPNVDIFVNSGAQASVNDLAFENSTGFLELPVGTYRLDVAQTGRTAMDAVLTVPAQALQANKRYTVVAFDNLANIAPLALEDDFDNLAADQIRVRAVHTAPAVGQVDIWNIPTTGAPSPLYTDVDFGVAGGYFDLPAGAYTLGFDLDNDANPDVVFSLPALAAGTVANVFATNDRNSNVFLLAQLQDGTVARVNPN